MYRLRKTILDMEEAEISNKEKLRHVTSSMNQQMSELERELREVLTEKEQMGEALQEEYQKWLDVEAKQKEHWEESESTRHNLNSRIHELENILSDARDELIQKDSELDENKITIDNYTSRITNLEIIIKNYETEKEKWSVKFQGNSDLIDSLTEKCHLLEEQLSKLQSLQDLYQSLQNSNEKLTSDHQTLNKKFETEISNGENLLQEKMRIEQVLQEKIFECKEKETSLKSKGDAERGLREESERLKSEAITYQERLRGLEKDVGEWTEYANKLEVDLKMMNDHIDELDHKLTQRDDAYRDLKETLDAAEMDLVKFQNFEKMYNDTKDGLKELN